MGFCPTGWLHGMQKASFPIRQKGCSSIHLVPYSEHSNYDELREYVKFLRPKKVMTCFLFENADVNDLNLFCCGVTGNFEVQRVLRNSRPEICQFNKFDVVGCCR